MTTISVYGRDVNSPFSLLGKDEKALCFALGYTLCQSPLLLQAFLKRVGVPRLRLKALGKARICLEQRGRGVRGITDIEILVGGSLHVVVEAKAGLALPTRQQLAKYSERLERSRAKRKSLIILTGGPPEAVVSGLAKACPGAGQFVSGLQWGELSAMALLLHARAAAESEERLWLRWFLQFLGEGYRMHSYTDEVWIVSASDKALWHGGWSYYDTHRRRRIYYDKKDKPRPLYIAFRHQGAVSGIHRVLRLEHAVPPIKYVPELRNLNKAWPHQPMTIWHLSDETSLPKPIPTGDPKMRARRFYCDFDVLISCKTIKQAVERMKARKKVAQ